MHTLTNSADPIELHGVISGQGRPLLLVHGFPLDHSMWNGQQTGLCNRFQILAPDLRGFGRSPVSPGVVTMEQHADDLARWLDQKKITEKIVFCGLSMGGYVAWQFWKRHADRLSHLILCDTRAIADPEEVARARLITAAKVLQEGPIVVADSMLPRLFAKTSVERQPEIAASIRNVMLGTHPEGIAASLRGMAQRPDVTAWLPQINVPSLVLCGELDEISRAEEMQGIAAKLPNARYVEIAGVGHMAPLEAPAATNDAILQFLQEAK